MANQLPIDGRGGSLYHINITIPIYVGQEKNITYADLDSMLESQTGISTTYGICFGLCLMATLQILVLTPSTKRGLPLYCANLACLCCLMVRLMTNILGITTTASGTAYYQLTADWKSTNPSTGSVANSVIGAMMAPLAFMLIQICLYIQASTVLITLKRSHKWLYWALLGYLVGLGFLAINIRVWYASQIIRFKLGCINFIQPSYLLNLVLSLYAGSIGSWSLVFAAQVGCSLYARRKMGGNERRNKAMSILMTTGIESMILPFLFSVLELSVVQISWFPEAEAVLVPSVAVLLPFGSLWASAVSNAAPHSIAYNQTGSGLLGTSGIGGCNGGDTKTTNPKVNPDDPRVNSVLSGNPYVNETRALHRTTASDYAERELSLLDAMADDDDHPGRGSERSAVGRHVNMDSATKETQSTDTQVPPGMV